MFICTGNDAGPGSVRLARLQTSDGLHVSEQVHCQPPPHCLILSKGHLVGVDRFLFNLTLLMVTWRGGIVPTWAKLGVGEARVYIPHSRAPIPVALPQPPSSVVTASSVWPPSTLLPFGKGSLSIFGALIICFRASGVTERLRHFQEFMALKTWG